MGRPTVTKALQRPQLSLPIVEWKQGALEVKVQHRYSEANTKTETGVFSTVMEGLWQQEVGVSRPKQEKAASEAREGEGK